MSETKCIIYFSPNVNVGVKTQVCSNYNYDGKVVSDIYLGLPAIVGVDRSNNFVHLLERNIKQLEGWKENSIYGGKGDFVERYHAIHSIFCHVYF